MCVKLTGRTKHLRMSSKALSLASTVFARMFRSQFKEGVNQRQAYSSSPICFPEDNGDALEITCYAVHHRTEKIPETLTIDTLANIGVLCDKYDLSRTLKPWSSMWMRENTTTPADADLPRLLSAAYCLDTPHMFSQISWKILCNQIGPFSGFPEMNEAVPRYEILGMLTVLDTAL